MNAEPHLFGAWDKCQPLFLHLTTKVFHLILTVHLLLIYPFLLNIFFVFFVFDVIGVSSYLTFIIFTVV